MVASTDPGWIQIELEMLMGLFNRMGLKTNTQKTVGMVFQPCWAVGIRADKAYESLIMGEGRSYQERQLEQVQCPEYGKDLARGSLDIHRQTQHDVVRGGVGQKDNKGYGN